VAGGLPDKNAYRKLSQKAVSGYEAAERRLQEHITTTICSRLPPRK
jgi:hypothetical protein